MRYTQQVTRLSDKPSVTETLLEALSQSGIRPAFSEPAPGRRARYRRIAGGLAVLLALAALGFVYLRPASGPVPAPGDRVAVVEIARGPVGVLPAGARFDPSRLLTLAAGEPIHAGAVIETGRAQTATGRAASGRAALRLAGGQSMRLDTDTRVRVASSSDLVLERGAVYIDSAAGAGVEVRTTLGVVRDLGTQFEVRLLGGEGADASLRVRVREGSVVLEHGGESHEAAAGVELSLGTDGTLTRGTRAIWGPHWDWVLETAPAPDIAGRPLRVFLDWVTREGGWTVRFADDETAELAGSAILHGDVRNLTPTEASAMVLTSAGLGYRLEEGTLVVGPMDADAAP